ncbi:DEAD/DEAH box helicase, partial [Treponema endosymbiont of Eucomonympha sp.]|uniref:DEAD/DEAH box helicase n=1 Tax=Treponema endosymbiont of Eucomonympha sp. TaxID=1580831 RepID=UPI00164F11D1
MAISATFSELGVPESLCATLASLGITEPTGVQQRIIPLIGAGKNVAFQSETGTGKTFAYLLPLLRLLAPPDGENAGGTAGDAQILIAAPTHELASQLKQTAQTAGGVAAAVCIGGSPFKPQLEALKKKPKIIAGTPLRF